jgi:MoaA/NifB/PqqE/SkfB family radical SAM enzyme/quercetin dioxygenase-like cupin family protein
MSTPKARHLPRHIRLDVSTACQLKCPACPTASGETGERLGVGFLRVADFRTLVDANPSVSAIELSNWGEIFLNKELPEMLRYAYEHNVAMYASNGVNLNTASEEVLEAVVKYKMRHLQCSIDGATQETYARYRVRGNLENVLANIRRINEWKVRYRSEHPKLTWQFVAFGHNEHEIEQARQLANGLGMDFYLKLSWADLYTEDFSPVRDHDLVRRVSGLGVASREEYRQVYGRDNIERKCCVEMWTHPQVNIDGRVLGCSINYWADFGNAFTEGLEEAINSESLTYARNMLMGKVPAREGIACTTCRVYHRIQAGGAWIREDEIAPPYVPSRRRVMLENKYLGFDAVRFLWRVGGHARHPAKAAKGLGRRAKRLFGALAPRRRITGALRGDVYPLSVVHEVAAGDGWTPYAKFAGPTAVAESFSCHSSALASGHCPHPPHEHRDEEILMMLAGDAQLVLAPEREGVELATVALGPGQFAYYPAGFRHTLRASDQGPANYVMFKWFSQAADRKHPLDYGRYDVADGFARMTAGEGFRSQLLFEGATHNLSKLHAHVSTLTPGAGYAPHADPYDVAIVVLRGSIETLGKRATAHDVVFYPAGTPHGIRNPADTVATYVVFEFHA